MRLIDLSQPVFEGCPYCPDDPAPSSRLAASHERDAWQVELLTLTSHTGSHVDAPVHKIPGGATLDEMPLERWVGRAWVLDLRGSAADRLLGEADLAGQLTGPLADRIVLLATGWGDRRARSDEWLNHAPHLGPDGARWLVNQGVRGVGIDHYTIGDDRVHEILLSAGVWIVEELRFPPEVFALPQPVEFWTLPVNLKQHSGAFCRPVIVVRCGEGEG